MTATERPSLPRQPRRARSVWLELQSSCCKMDRSFVRTWTLAITEGRLRPSQFTSTYSPTLCATVNSGSEFKIFPGSLLVTNLCEVDEKRMEIFH
jgi:hypothetical protein